MIIALWWWRDVGGLREEWGVGSGEWEECGGAAHSFISSKGCGTIRAWRRRLRVLAVSQHCGEIYPEGCALVWREKEGEGGRGRELPRCHRTMRNDVIT